MPTLRRANMCRRMNPHPRPPRPECPKPLPKSVRRTALNVLVGVMRNKDATAAAKVSAANAILDRGWGKATQPVGNGDHGALELIHRIERVIVHPENPDSPDL
jgi:hypothetical protein